MANAVASASAGARPAPPGRLAPRPTTTTPSASKRVTPAPGGKEGGKGGIHVHTYIQGGVGVGWRSIIMGRGAGRTVIAALGGSRGGGL